MPVHHYQRDGWMRTDSNGGGAMNYEPNSYGGPVESAESKISPFEVSGEADSIRYPDDDHFTQAGDLYRLMTDEEKDRLIQAIVHHMKDVEKEEIKRRQIEHFYKADEEYGSRVAEGLGIDIAVK